MGAKLEHVISRLAQDVTKSGVHANEAATGVRPSDEHFWFNKPRIVLNLIHFILFQNSFEIAFFFWILVRIYGYLDSHMRTDQKRVMIRLI